jgi:hypothetical protein
MLSTEVDRFRIKKEKHENVQNMLVLAGRGSGWHSGRMLNYLYEGSQRF